MRSFAIHLIALLALLAIPALAADMPDAERTKIEQATAARIQADRDKVQIDAIANRAAQLLRDPATQILGDAQGDVTIVEFFDYQCPYCKAVQPRLEALIAGDKKVRWVVKEFPILSPESLVASKAALASVKQGKYAQFHTAMMDHKGRLEMSDIWAIAQSVGLDAERLKADMTAPEIGDAIIANFNLARSVKVTGTPGIIIQGKPMNGASAEIDFPKEVAAARAAKN